MAWHAPMMSSRATWSPPLSAEDGEAFALRSGDRNPRNPDEAFTPQTRVGQLEVLRCECLAHTMLPHAN
jgi:hypothetical protein